VFAVLSSPAPRKAIVSYAIEQYEQNVFMSEHANAIFIKCPHFYPAIFVACNNNHMEYMLPTYILTVTVANINTNLQPNPELHAQKPSHPWFIQART
jgi:hypothetical protein